jgi:hypothetical protein
MAALILAMVQQYSKKSNEQIGQVLGTNLDWYFGQQWG